ncbi:CAP domain-containing protein [Cryptosporangium sp. NPDC048952]|uniref:CAP domain-containing protein n=1 Tax=Cryptosporangium sp. NPDC048952 TaxID=3363961 RepID=UPI0037180AB8
MRTTVGKKIGFGIVAAVAFTTMAVGAGTAASAAPLPAGGYDRYASQYQYDNYNPWASPRYTRPAKPVTTKPVTTTPATRPSGSTTTAPTTSAPVGSTANTTTSVSAPVQAVLTQINKVRAANGVKALTLNNQLTAAAHQHNLTMASGCGLSHQCSGEGNAGTRISAQGLKWNAYAENIGYGSTSAATDAAHTATATRITQSMIDEVAPNDGHRRNILNASLGQIGIDLYRDAKGTLWMTQDFAN